MTTIKYVSSTDRKFLLVAQISRLISLIIVVLGALVILGWIIDNPTLKSGLPNLATMKFNTALLFILTGLSLFLINTEQRIATACAIIAGFIATLTLSEYVFDINLGIDELIIADDISNSNINGVIAGRMSIITAVNFCLYSTALLMLKRDQTISQLFTLSALTLSLIALVGYLYDVQSLEQVFPYSTLAIHTAIAFVAFGIGIFLIQTDTELVRLIFSNNTGGIIIRRFVPIAILIPLILGWVQLQGQLRNLYNPEFGASLNVILTIIMLLATTGWMSKYLDQIDSQRQHAEKLLKQSHNQLEIRVAERTKELSLANEVLRASEARFEGLLSTAHDAIISVDDHHIITLFNQGAERIFGYQAQDIIGKPLNYLIPEQFHNNHNHYVTEFGVDSTHARTMAPDRLEVKGQHKDGTTFPAEVSISSLLTGNKRIFTAVVRDITTRKSMTDALIASEERFRLLVNNVRDYAIYMLDPVGNIVSWNDGAEQIKGYKTKEILNQHFSVFFTQADKNSGKPQQLLKRAEQKGHLIHEDWHLHKDGSTFWAQIVITALHDEIGKLIGFSEITRDLTERKQIETGLRKALKQEQELGELKSRLVAMASHEFRTPLTIILSSADLLRLYRDRKDKQWADNKLNLIINQVTHLTSIIQDVLDLGRLQSDWGEFNPIDITLDNFCQNIIEEFQNNTDTTCELQYTIRSKDLTVKVDQTLMRLILTNLISNAIKYSPSDKAVSVNLEQVDDCVEICVQDQGIGIPESNLKHIFQPFYRATNVEGVKGTGLGLSITKQAIEMHGGSIHVESQINVGTTFTIRIPLNTTF